MFDAWRSGDAALLDEVVKKANEGSSLTEVLDEKMLYGRNPAMLSKIEIFLAGNQVRCRRRATPNRQARSCRNVEGEGVQDQAIVNWMQPSDLVWDNARPGGHLVACNSQFESALRAWPAGCGVARLANMRRLFDAARFVHPARPGAPFTPLLTVTGH